MNFDSLGNPGMLDAMLYSWYTYRNSSVWKNKHELWRKWLRAN